MQTGLLQTFHHRYQTLGVTAWALSVLLFVFYVVIYFTNFLNPVAESLHLRGKWDLYGILYTIAIVVGGIYFIKRHGHSRYHKLRTISVIFFQVVFAYSIPTLMEVFGQKGFAFNNFWPLKMNYLSPAYIFKFPLPIILWAIFGSLILVPILTFWFGKRWFCSWVCGCGGLAETAGEPFRHLSNKSSKAWKFEKISMYSVVLLAITTTVLVMLDWGIGENYATLSLLASKIRGWYGFVVVALLSGIFGVGLYPLLGSRVWCRFFCPLAGLMGLIQKFGRFRITVKDDMCISCGNCSTYCEMGIDVRMYAQNNTSFKRAACVGCGICAHVCPRGVLKLENKWDLSVMADSTKVQSVDL